MDTSVAQSGCLASRSTGAAHHEPLAAIGGHREHSQAGAATTLSARLQSTSRPRTDDIHVEHAASAASRASWALRAKAGSVSS